jgi:hypothetical protein
MTQMMHAIGLGGDLLPAISLGIPTALLPASRLPPLSMPSNVSAARIR